MVAHLFTEPERQSCLPLVHIRHLGRIAEVLLEAAAPPIAAGIPFQVPLGPPVQQIPGGVPERGRVAGVDYCGIATGRQASLGHLNRRSRSRSFAYTVR